MAAHPEPDSISAFVAGRSTAVEADAIEAHIDTCDECRKLVSELALMSGPAVPEEPTDPNANPGASNTDLGTVPVGAMESEPTMTDRPALLVNVGDVIEGRYRITKLLGQGGMGSVFEAHHEHLNQRVALKFIDSRLAMEPQAAARFLREARSAARLETPYVCRVLDMGRLKSGVPYLVMELLTGETLERRLQMRGKLPVAEAVGYVRQALLGVREAHAQGITHRDLKPANLFLAQTRHGELVKVVDFGVARTTDPEIEAGLTTHTVPSMMLGSPLYMAPEQLPPTKPVDARTDIWAIGVLLYELISGKPPFLADSYVAVSHGIRNKPHAPLKTAEPSCPSALSAVVDRCLAKDPAERFASVDELMIALDGAQARRPWGLIAAAALLFVAAGAGVGAIVAQQNKAVDLPPVPADVSPAPTPAVALQAPAPAPAPTAAIAPAPSVAEDAGAAAAGPAVDAATEPVVDSAAPEPAKDAGAVAKVPRPRPQPKKPLNVMDRL